MRRLRYSRIVREAGEAHDRSSAHTPPVSQFGKHVGTDVNGNQYFENTKDYAGGALQRARAPHTAHAMSAIHELAPAAPCCRPAPLGRVRGLEELL